MAQAKKINFVDQSNLARQAVSARRVSVGSTPTQKKKVVKASKSFSKASSSAEDLSSLLARSCSSFGSRQKLSSRLSTPSNAQKANWTQRVDAFKTTSSASVTTVSSNTSKTISPGVSPLTFIVQKLNEQSSQTVRTATSTELDNLFQPVTPEQRNAYDKEAVMAVHKQDMALLRTWHEQGRTLQAANAFGESLLHLACRRGYLEMVTFLVEEVKVSLWIRDDTGRSPLHYACWTPEPSFALVDFIIKHDRDLLYVSDKRGHTPLDYTRKEHWKDWISHFECKNMVEELLPSRTELYVKQDHGTANLVVG